MRAFTDKEILDRVESLPTFKGWVKGIYNVWVRSKADAYDVFDDKCFTYQVRESGQRPVFIMKRDGTTNAGSYGLTHFRDYNSKGCAVLKADYMVYGSHVKGFHKHNPLNPAYVQAKVWPNFRDNNGNQKAEEIGQEYYDIIGANDHKAGVFSKWIRNWSTACLVTAIRKQYDAWLAFMAKNGYPPLNTAILKEF